MGVLVVDSLAKKTPAVKMSKNKVVRSMDQKQQENVIHIPFFHFSRKPSRKPRSQRRPARQNPTLLPQRP